MDILAKRNEITKELAEGVKNALEKMGIIQGYTTFLNMTKANYIIVVQSIVKCHEIIFNAKGMGGRSCDDS